MEKYVCIHGHFYQPPRENPWLEEVERQDAAHPFRDWNTRIAEECYYPNAASRIYGPHHKIIEVVNNYAKMSFDFGPTLMSWLQRHRDDVYQAVLHADQASQARFSGHGAALAQAYNHMIMPLAHARDKRTQVRWGIADFTLRFGRRPEGMWLPETAVDYLTLEVLAEEGIHFTVLAPHQAKAVRARGDTVWHSLVDDPVDTTQAYRCPLPSGRSITLFFYQGQVSQAVASGRYLVNGELLAEKLLDSVEREDDRPCLIHIATDGETYGHHFRHADMALAYCLHHLEAKGLAQVTVYGEFLEKYPPTQEVEIHENSAWSCSHGVDRWRSNCGCHHGQFPSGRQAYRQTLRETLDWLRDQLALLYEQRIAPYCDDPWALRDAYINVINDRRRENVEQFLTAVTDPTPDPADPILLLKLLEMQRHAMLMFTSCAWFFDDISGLEAVQVLQYAARAMQLASEVGGQDHEPEFMRRLEQAPCNEHAYAHGAEVYRQRVVPCRVDLNRVGGHLALSMLFAEVPETSQVYCYTVRADARARHEREGRVLVTGRATVTSNIVWEDRDLDFAAVFLRNRQVTGAVNARRADATFASLQSALKAALARDDDDCVMQVMNEAFQGNTYAVQHLFKDEQRQLLDHLMQGAWQDIETSFRQIYERNLPIMQLMRSVHIPLPPALAVPAQWVINQTLCRLVECDPTDAGRVQDLLDTAVHLGVSVAQDGPRHAAGQKVLGLLTRLTQEPGDIQLLQAAHHRLCSLLHLIDPLVLQRVQNILFNISHTAYPDQQRRGEAGDRTAAQWCELVLDLAQHLDVAI